MKATMTYRVILGFGWVMALATPSSAQFPFNLRRDIPWRIGEVVSPKTPTKIVAVWTDAVLHQAGKPATRGFGGRLMFYGPEDNTPLKVEGTLVVYAFDEEGRLPTDVKPDRKYVFPPDQFARHYSKSKLGHSYSVWIPWDEVGGPRKEISLIARFIPKNGSAIISAPSRQILPGLPPSESGAGAAPRSGLGPAPVRSEVSAHPGQTAQRPPPGTRWPSATSYPHEPSGPPLQQVASIPSPASEPSVSPVSRQPLFSEGESFQPTANPLRRTSYEEAFGAGEAEVLRQEQPLTNQPRMKTATIPVPASWLRSSRASGSWSASQKGDPSGPPPQHFPPTDPSRTPDPRTQPPGSHVRDTESCPSGRRENQAGGTPWHANPMGGAAGEQVPRNWPSQRPSTRSGPLGPQAPTGPIGPQARDRVALPPLP